MFGLQQSITNPAPIEKPEKFVIPKYDPLLGNKGDFSVTLLSLARSIVLLMTGAMPIG